MPAKGVSRVGGPGTAVVLSGAVATAAVLTSCGTSNSAAPSKCPAASASPSRSAPGTVRLPPLHADFVYRIGGASPRPLKPRHHHGEDRLRGRAAADVQRAPGHHLRARTWTVFDNGLARSRTAVEFVRWMNSPAQDMRWDIPAGGLPLSTGTAARPEWREHSARTVGLDVFTDTLRSTRVRPVHAAYPQISQALGEAIVSVLPRAARRDRPGRAPRRTPSRPPRAVHRLGVHRSVRRGDPRAERRARRLVAAAVVARRRPGHPGRPSHRQPPRRLGRRSPLPGGRVGRPADPDRPPAPQCAALNSAYVSVTDLVVRAATDGNPRHIRHAAMADPATAAALPVERIWDLCDDLVKAHGELLQPELRALLGH